MPFFSQNYESLLILPTCANFKPCTKTITSVMNSKFALLAAAAVETLALISALFLGISAPQFSATMYFSLLSSLLSQHSYSQVRSYFILLDPVANFPRLREILLILPIFVSILGLVPWNVLKNGPCFYFFVNTVLYYIWSSDHPIREFPLIRCFSI